MREIKFRGLQPNRVDWVYGDLLTETPISKPRIIWLNQIDECSFNEESVEVIPETVGQFTGLLDKNGKEIYEGDLVRHGRKSTFNPHPIHEVRFETCAFYLKNIENRSEVEFNNLDKFDLEVIGNIHQERKE